MTSCSLCSRICSGLDLFRFRTLCHNHCEFMCAPLCPVGTLSLSHALSLLYTLSPLLPQCSLCLGKGFVMYVNVYVYVCIMLCICVCICVFVCVSLRTKYSAVSCPLYLYTLASVDHCVSHHLLQIETSKLRDTWN